MPEKNIYTVLSNRPIAKDVFAMQLAGSTVALKRPGQFVNIQLNGFYLRRPFSVSRWSSAGFEVVYKIVGDGTAQMAHYGRGTQLDIMVGLGNGFNVKPTDKTPPLLVGGGVGVPPIYALAAALQIEGVTANVALGFRSKEDVFFAEAFEKLGCTVHIATDDGTLGTKGTTATIAKEQDYDYYYACGPNAMLEAIHAVGKEKGADGQLLFEERMGCGFGTCMGCSHQTKNGPKRVCVEGPVFTSQEVLFNGDR